MNDKLLYFPYINIPNNNWTIKSLLYWDAVGIIVPNDTDDFFQKFTNDLISTEFIQPIVPYQHMHKIPQFDFEFSKLIHNPNLDLNEKRQNFEQGHIARIHVQKFGPEVMEYLVDQKIAVKDRENWGWYFVESKMANLIMLFLATLLAEVEKYTPSTDNLIHLNLSLSQNSLESKLNDLRNQVVEDLLPYPINPDLKKFKKFKEKYQLELKQFRVLVESLVLDLSRTTTSEEYSRLKDIRMYDINLQRDEILHRLNESKLGKLLFGSVCGLVASFVGGFNPYAFLNAVYSATQNANSTEVKNGYAYLALVDKEFKN